MGDGVTDEQELVIEIGSAQAGGKKGQLIVEDIEYNATRDNNERHGIGNDEPQAIEYGNKTYSVDATKALNEREEQMISEYMSDEPLSGAILLPNETINFGKLDWNDVTLEASDGDGAPSLSVSFNAREVTPS